MASTLDLARSLGAIRTRKFNRRSVSAISNGIQPFDFFIVVDFEATCWAKEDGPGYPSEVIEFPAVILRSRDGALLDEFHHYVQPTENPKLSEFCQNLTGITQKQVDSGMPIGTVLMLFSKWLEEMRSKHGFVVNDIQDGQKSAMFITWSDWDFNVCLNLECKRKSLKKPKCFDLWCDLRFVYSKFYGRKPNGLNGALQDVGIKFEGREHSGLCDAKNTAKLAHKLVRDGCRLSVTKHSKDVIISDSVKRILFDPTLSCLVTPEQRKKLVITPPENKSIINKTPDQSSAITPQQSKKFTTTPPLCKCGRRAKCLTVRRQGPNQGKLFYSCSKGAGAKDRCRFFSWHIQQQSSNRGLSLRNTNVTPIKPKSTTAIGKFLSKSAVPTCSSTSVTNFVNFTSPISPQYFGNVKLKR